MSKNERTINGWLAISSSLVAEIMAHQDFDSITVDLQHGMIDFSDALSMLQAVSTKNVTPLIRVPSLESAIIMKCLDAGAYGIICPMVNTAQDAEDFVKACSYAPRGQRSFGPTRALFYAGRDYPVYANEAILKFAMIETVEALSNVDSIVRTPDLDGVYIGPSDLSLSMGYEPGLDSEQPEVIEAIKSVLSIAKGQKLFVGIHTASASYARRMHDLGFDMISVSTDVRLLAGAASSFVSLVRNSKLK